MTGLKAQKRSDVVDAAEFVATKLRWQLALLRDTTLSTSARLFGALLMHDFDDRVGGYAWRSQGQKEASAADGADSYRARTGFNVRTLQLAAKELEAAGYIRIDRPKLGRGHSNRYWPRLEKANPGPAITPENPAPGPAFDVENPVSAPAIAPESPVSGPAFGPEKPVYDARNAGPQTALLLQDFTNSPLPPFAPRTAFRPDEADAARGSARTWVGVPRELRDQVVAIPQLGEGWAKSWLDHCAWDGAGRVLFPRTSFAKGRIEEALRPYRDELAVTVGEARGLGAASASAAEPA